MTLKLQSNLQKFSAIATVVSLWDHEEIRAELKQYFADCKTNGNKSTQDRNWQSIVKKVSDHATLLNVPEELLSSLKNFIVPIGDKIFYWNMYLLRYLDLKYEYSYKIYFTSFGTIDECKIFEMYWLPILAQENLRRFIKRDHDLDIFFVACLFVQKKFIKEYLQQMIIETEMCFAPVKFIGRKCTVNGMIIIWLCFYLTKDKTKAIELYKEVKNWDNLYSYLFLACVNHGLLQLTKYFWNKLSQKDKEEVIMQGAETCISKLKLKAPYEEKSVEILTFLINNMTPDVRNQFISENIQHVFGFFMTAWPFQEMIVQIFNSADDIELFDIESLFLYTLKCIADEVQTEKFLSKNIAQEILAELYKRHPVYSRLLLATKNDALLLKMLDKFDISLWSLILNDTDLTDFRERLFDLGTSKFFKFVRSKKFALLNKFMKNVFATQSEQKEFKLKMNIIPDLLSEGEFNVADELLNWLFDSDEERILTRKQFDPLKVCSDFKNFKYELLNELLLWLYDKEEERQIVKVAMKNNDEFICDKIVKIWNRHCNTDQNECFDFLKWLSDSEDEAIKLKNKLIISANVVKVFCNTLPCLKCFSRIDQLFQFFSLSPKKVTEIKRIIINDIDEWITTYIVTQNNFELAQEIVNWIFSEENEKEKTMKDYINSFKGAILLMKTFGICKCNQGKPLLFLLNSWVKLYGSVKIIQNHLRSIDPKPSHTEQARKYYVFYTLFRSPKKGKKSVFEGTC